MEVITHMNSTNIRQVNTPTPTTALAGDSFNTNAGKPAIATSIESAEKSEPMAASLRARVARMTRDSGRDGLTINQAQKQIQDHKDGSISARFSELVKSGAIVRVFVGYGQRTRRFPNGVPKYVSRYDEETRRNVSVHWAPEFAPSAPEPKVQAQLVGLQ